MPAAIALPVAGHAVVPGDPVDVDQVGVVLHRGPVTVATNLGPRTQTLRLLVGASTRLLAASDPAVSLTRHGLVLPPDTVAILIDEDGPGAQELVTNRAG